MIIERPQPIAIQVTHILRRRIHEGIYKPGIRLPPEGVLAAEFGISRTTLRSVMTSLAAEGLILRKQGNGTYVNHRSFEVKAQLNTFWSFTELIIHAGFKPTVQNLSVQHCLPSRIESESLEIGANDSVYSLERLFCADNKAVIYSINLIPTFLLQGEINRFEAEISIYELLLVFANQEIAYSSTDIQADLLPESVAHILQREINTPILRLLDVFYNKDNLPISMGLNYYDEKTLGMRLVRTRST
jgi:DNA-binding GntR family transcriptional regulator